MPHKFKVGDDLTFTGRALLRVPTQSDVASKPCKVTRLMPTENGPAVYRIQCALETFERTARETDLN